MAEMKFVVVARPKGDPSGAGSFYYRGPGTGLFNKDQVWVGALMDDCAKRMTREEAEAVVAEKAPLFPERDLIIRPVHGHAP